MAIRELEITRPDGRLLVDGVEVSRHRELKEAVEAAATHLDQDPQPTSSASARRRIWQ